MKLKQYYKYLKEHTLIILLIIILLLFIIAETLAIFSDFIYSTVQVKSSIINIPHTMAVNGSTDISKGFYIEYNEVKKITILASNIGESSIKVRAKAFIRLEFPAGTPIEDVKGLYLYPISLSDDEIRQDMTLENPIKAIIPTILHNDQGSPVVLQYEINSTSIAIEANSQETINVKMACSQTPESLYKGIYANIYSTVIAVQYKDTIDSDINEHIPEHQFGTFSSAVASSSIILDYNEITINGLMSGAILKVTILPESVYNRQITWTSSDPTVATVDQNGIVVSRNYGITTITAKLGTRTATCVVTVEP